MGNTECCGRLKDNEEDKMLMIGGDGQFYKDVKIPLQAYDVKSFTSIITNLSRDKIRFDDLINELSLEKGSEMLAKDSLLMKYLNNLPGKVH